MGSSTRFLPFVAVVVSLFALAAQGSIIKLAEPVYISDIPSAGIVAGDKVFTDFDVTAICGVPCIMVQPVQIDYASGTEFGLAFYGTWSAMGMHNVSSLIEYTVTDVGNPIAGATLWLATGGGYGDGQASVSETLYSGLLPSSYLGNLYTFMNGNAIVTDQDTEFGTTQSLRVVTGVQANGGTLIGSSAAVTKFYQTFAEVPEPATVALLLVGWVVALRRSPRSRTS